MAKSGGGSDLDLPDFARAPGADVAAIAPGGTPAPDLGDLKPFTQAIAGTDAKFEMLPIPAGEFQMGSPASEKKRHADEGPQIDVQVDAFYMAKYTVTWAEYNSYLSNYQRLANEGVPHIPADKGAPTR